MVGGIEMCSLCAPDKVSPPRSWENITSSVPIYSALDLARPEKRAKRIRSHLKTEYGLTYCVFPHAFIPEKLCSTCKYCGVDGDKCYKLEGIRAEDQKRYNALMGDSKNKLCALEVGSLAELGYNYLTIEFVIEEEDERRLRAAEGYGE